MKDTIKFKFYYDYVTQCNCVEVKDDILPSNNILFIETVDHKIGLDSGVMFWDSIIYHLRLDFNINNINRIINAMLNKKVKLEEID